ncbi:hypothetical protein [Streptomyces phaeochromogenes]|uniref:hypothetical protein n=1 Tax=Streptomyces phaeochromogenes TaxID=1923 RepID=UPI0033D4171F
MLEGVLIAESLRAGAQLTGIPLRITKLTRVEMTDPGQDQPRLWTLLEFAADELEAERLAHQLASSLSPTGGWYTDFHTSRETFVVFADKVFRYPRGEAKGRREAQDYGRSVGVPEQQLDWHA